MAEVQLYDTTLRDGMQGQGMSLSAQEKVRVVHALDRLGVQYIEAGFPTSNPKEVELFEMLSKEDLHAATVVAFGMTRRTGTAAELVPVREVDDHPIGEPGEITGVVQAKFEDALHGRAEEYLEWLDFVEASAEADRPSKVSS